MSTSNKRSTCPNTLTRRTDFKRAPRPRMTHRILIPTSFKRTMLADSTLEWDAAKWCEFASVVTNYVMQPLTLKFLCDGRWIESDPDIEVTYVDGSTELLEVKYAEVLSKPDVRQKCRRVKDHCASIGMRYRVVTEKQIRRCPTMLKNFSRLLGYRLDPMVLPDIGWMQPRKEYLVAELANKIGSDTEVFRLIAQQKLACDLTQLLTLKTRVRKAKPTDYADFI